MIDNFTPCVGFTFQFEGGFVNNPRDPGGATNFGVTRAVLSAWRHKAVSVEDVRAMAQSEAQAIYRALCWDHIGGDQLPHGVDLMAFDIAVNMGTGRANAWLLASARLAPMARIAWLDQRRLGFWRALRTFDVFGRGWCARETACLKRARLMASA